jgi:hypothetical protein
MGRLAPLLRKARGIDRWTIVRIGVLAGLFYASWHAIVAFGRPYNFFDMKIYHGAVEWWASGNELYRFIAPETTLGFTYPPFAGLLMLPMVFLPVKAAGWINIGGSLLALTIVLAALVGPIARRYGWTPWFAVGVSVALATAIEPVRETFGYGQVNLLLFALIMADMVALRWRARSRTNAILASRSPLNRFLLSGAWAGVGVGLATSIKLTPALFIVYFLITRQWRVAITAIASGIAACVVTALVASHESMTYFSTVIFETNRVGAADMTPNQSLAGILARLYDSTTTPTLLWLTFSMLALAVGLSRASHAHADGDELTAFTLIGLSANVISPISWSHHLVFVIPAMVVLVDTAMRRRSASQGLTRRGMPQFGVTGLTGIRNPIWFPGLTGLRHAVGAVTLYVLFVVSPIWPYEHQLPAVSHYADGLWGALMENSLALSLIVLVVVLPWRPGAEPAFYAEPPRRPGFPSPRTNIVVSRDRV